SRFGGRGFLRLDDFGNSTPLGQTPVDAIPAINAAIAAGLTKFVTGCAIIVPAGQWFLGSPIVLPNGFALIGETPDSGQLRALSTFSGAAMVMNQSNSQE